MFKKVFSAWFFFKNLIFFLIVYGVFRNIRVDVYVFQSSIAKRQQVKVDVGRICSSVEEATKGFWVFRKNLTRKEIEDRKQKDAKIRLAMDWPANMTREDKKCGKQNLIPGYRLQGQCDADSSIPCCNQDEGMCGIGPKYCNCSECTDLRTMIPAELADWKTESGCRLQEFPHSEYCDLLRRHKIRIAFVGDSLIRQLHTMMILTLTNDFERGSIPVNASDENKKLCEGESQITLKKCSVEIVAQTTNEISASSLCDGSMIAIDLVQDYHTVLIPEVDNKINELFEKEGAWIIGGVGLHYQLNFEECKTRYLDKVWTKLNSSGNGWPKLIWVEIHGTFGFLRQDIGPINKNVVSFNQKVNRYWQLRGIQVVETFNISKGLKSYDGRHYGIGFNKLKIQLIFNYLYQFYTKK